MKRNLFTHIRPRTVPAAALRFRLTWGLGGAAVLMVAVQLVTGMLLNLGYEPTIQGAYSSVQRLHYDVCGGRLCRNLHHWTGHALVVVVLLHLVRVFCHDAYRGPRYRSWVIGLVLLLLILLANFSGYLLPWDQRAYWAVTIATAVLGYLPGVGGALLALVRGGEEVGGATLHLFHVLHSGILPLLLLFFLTWHWWWIRRAGGLFLPGAGQGKTGRPAADLRPARPHLFVREKAAAAVVLAALVYWAILADAPLGEMANPAYTPATVRAPWYFIGFQELLIHVSPAAAVLVLPPLLAAYLLGLPLVGADDVRGRRVVRLLFFTLAAGYLALTVTGLFFRGPGMQPAWPF
ncbi:MAG: cytochrome b N-terminal domain-containing protein [Deltaproteobacteria bacterium]|nr:cytochrome b N-terminal domain-containing protein [Deltaproteobacteria bacterium]